MENITFYISSDVFWKNDLGPLVLETAAPFIKTLYIQYTCKLFARILYLSKQVACFSLFGEYMDVLQDTETSLKGLQQFWSLCVIVLCLDFHIW